MDEEVFESLIISLGNMHRFEIIHMDINPENIMWSRSKRKPVFIDFEFSDIIKEEPGYKTLTSFHGTPLFISADMLKLFQYDSSKEAYVDLYYNDLVALFSTRDELRREKIKSFPNYSQ